MESPASKRDENFNETSDVHCLIVSLTSIALLFIAYSFIQKRFLVVEIVELNFLVTKTFFFHIEQLSSGLFKTDMSVLGDSESELWLEIVFSRDDRGRASECH